MTDIQRARDVLAKWRDVSTPAPWVLRWVMGDPEWPVVIAEGYGAVVDTVRGGHKPDDARLIVGTAGNPDLLDAIDLVLQVAERFERKGRGSKTFGIAAAIIAAERRMSA